MASKHNHIITICKNENMHVLHCGVFVKGQNYVAISTKTLDTLMGNVIIM